MSKVVEIFVSEAANAPMVQLEKAALEAGRGIVGDRYYTETGTFSELLAGKPDKELTMIEKEFVDEFNQEYGFSYRYCDFRRNLVTEGVRLNELVDKEFYVGSVKCRGTRLCEPCAHLSGVLVPEIMKGMLHKAGLRVQILESGAVHQDDSIIGAG